MAKIIPKVGRPKTGRMPKVTITLPQYILNEIDKRVEQGKADSRSDFIKWVVLSYIDATDPKIKPEMDKIMEGLKHADQLFASIYELQKIMGKDVKGKLKHPFKFD